MTSRYLVGDDQFKRLVAILRLAVPYTGLICTAREPAEIRREVMGFGVSQIDAGSRIELGGYTEAGDTQVMEREQFQLGDIRPLDQVMSELLRDGYIPSFCTACYRLGRTGEHFMEFAIPGFIQNMCTPNALSTLMEYLVDYASPETRAAGEKMIAAGAGQDARRAALKHELLERLRRIRETDARDLYFRPGWPAWYEVAGTWQARARHHAIHPRLSRSQPNPTSSRLTDFRQETDLLGTREVPAEALYGIHTLRAVENFPLGGRAVHPRLIHAYGAVKLACARTNHELGWWDDARSAAIEAACQEMMDGQLDRHIVVDALQGGAGTSTNMNVNEVLANRALQILGRPLGDYDDRRSAGRRQPAPIDQRHLSHGTARGGHLEL